MSEQQMPKVGEKTATKDEHESRIMAWFKYQMSGEYEVMHLRQLCPEDSEGAEFIDGYWRRYVLQGGEADKRRAEMAAELENIRGPADAMMAERGRG